jgi:hypothetical protein
MVPHEEERGMRTEYKLQNRWSIHIPAWSIGWGTMGECSLCDVGNIPLTVILYWQTGSILNARQCEDLSGLVSLGQWMLIKFVVCVGEH